ncbi:integral membrane protein [Fusarium mundagurra]|uniref:Integral membrane protein n=1 Tax=Fusarium mundagurra TaxID=1567541 RepID=A0A8H5XS21_9HYPO|nr:integral membrane protein [Fusarium mundagurra]
MQCDLPPRCPKSREVSSSAYWYRIRGAPDDQWRGIICQYCYAQNIKDTPFADDFEQVQSPEGVATSCRFWTPRVSNLFSSVLSGLSSLDALVNYMRVRAEIPPCPGSNTVNADANYLCFGTTAIEGLTVCEACTEDWLGVFSDHTIGQYPAGTFDEWQCAMRRPSIQRSVRRAFEADDWDACVKAVADCLALQLPVCTGQETFWSSNPWYASRSNKYYICMTCFVEETMLTEFEDEFEFETGQNLDIAERLTGLRKCALGASPPMQCAVRVAIEHNDKDAFHQAISLLCQLPPCTAHITSEYYWTLPGGCTTFSVCYPCFIGRFWVPGYCCLLEQRKLEPNVALACAFNTSHPRCQEYILALGDAVDRGNSSIFFDFITKYSSIPVCPRNTAVAGRAWWGHPEVLFCEDCYESWAKELPLPDSLPVQGQVIEDPCICQIWSPRMRTLWTAVCAAECRGAAISEFRDIGSQRLQVYLETVPRIEQIRAIQRAYGQNVAAQAMAAANYADMQTLKVASGVSGSETYGSSSLGWHETREGAEASKASQAMFSNVNASNSLAAELCQLAARWDGVE